MNENLNNSDSMKSVLLDVLGASQSELDVCINELREKLRNYEYNAQNLMTLFIASMCDISVQDMMSIGGSGDDGLGDSAASIEDKSGESWW